MSTPALIDILSDDDLATILADILATKSGGLTREGECLLAGLCARHIVEQLGFAGLAAVRVEMVRAAAADLWGETVPIGHGDR